MSMRIINGEKVEQYLERQNKNQREIIDIIRNLIHTNFPKLRETGMEEGLWYDGKFYLATFKDHVNLGVNINGLTEEEKNNFQGSGKTMRHLKFFSMEDINKSNLLDLLRLVYAKTHCDHDIKWK